METRINIGQIEPEAYKALAGIDKYLLTTPLDKHYRELIKIRASQINGCTYCINLHTKDARKMGETEQRLYLLSAWRETDLFTEEEHNEPNASRHNGSFEGRTYLLPQP
jgi:AhpD family alkylhydroperoxidase